jgi:uncharacterized protein YvpB
VSPRSRILAFPRPFSLLLALSLLFLPTGRPSSTLADVTRFLPGFPLLKQQHALTCESSAVSMGTYGHLTEGQLMAVIPRNPNPNLGFRGNPDAPLRRNPLIDYGVYAAPLSAALARYGYRSDALTYANDSTLKSYIARGWPVVVWVTHALWRETPHLAENNGVSFVLVPYEHAVLMVGYTGQTILAHDPLTGRLVAYDWRNFNRVWGYFGNMALAVEPCPAPAPVTGLTPTLTGPKLTWSWQPSPRAARYSIKVTRAGTLIYQGTQTALTYSLPAPIAGAAYQFTITAIGPCGSASAPTSVWYQMPPATPTPAPTASPTPTSSPTPTATSSL